MLVLWALFIPTATITTTITTMLWGVFCEGIRVVFCLFVRVCLFLVIVFSLFVCFLGRSFVRFSFYVCVNFILFI